MNPVLFQFIHYLGLFLLFSALSGLIACSIIENENLQKWKKFMGAMHGIGFLLVFIGGFGNIPFTGLKFPWAGWIWAKLVLLVLLGIFPAIISRRKLTAFNLFIGVLLIGVLALIMVLFKPF